MRLSRMGVGWRWRILSSETYELISFGGGVGVAVSPTRSVFPDFGPDPDFFHKKVWKKSVFCPKSLYFYKMATYYTLLESLGPGQFNKNIFKIF